MSIRVLPLEPDQWRYLAIVHVLTSDQRIDLSVLGNQDLKHILSLRKAPPELDPDVIMLARRLVADSKLPLLRRITELFPRARVLVYGYVSNVTDIADFIAAGATGYFVLSSSPAELVEAVKHVARGLIWAPSETFALMVDQIRKPNGTGTLAAAGDSIAPHELTLLNLLNDGLTNKEIASALGIAEVTVKSKLTKLYRRFKIRTRLQLLSYAIKHELILEERPRSAILP